MSGSRIALAPPEGSPSTDRGAGDGEEGTGFLKRAEVRDVLAWMRLLVDPQDAAAVVRALARPPIELRQVDLARVIALARRRKLDLVLGLNAATESPQVPPEARERIQRFVELHRGAAAELDHLEPDVFIGRLIERLGMPGRPLLAPEDAAEQNASLRALHRLAVDFVRLNPRSSARELVRHLATVVPEAPGENGTAENGTVDLPVPTPDGAGAATVEPEGAVGGDRELRDPSTPTAVGDLEKMLHLLREEVLGSVARIGGRLGELRLDTDLDISHGVVRYLELLKLSALLQHPAGQSFADALSDTNARLLAATTPLEREIFQTSTLDDTLLAGGSDDRARAQALAPRGEPSLGPFLPRKGIGLALSASDIQTYRSCPLRYKFARVLRIPTEQTVHQRFGIVVHQVLERYHSEGGDTLAQMLELLDGGWRRAGFGESDRDRELYGKAHAALTRYHARLHGQDSEPVWFERAFDFRLGPHHLRGRVDRVDRLAGDAEEQYELIDYKTSRPKTAAQLQDDIQLSLYALAAREAWQLESSSQAYYYVLDDLKVPVPRSDRDAESVKDIVLEVGEGILAQAFEPTPSHAACSICDYRIVCPAAEG
ncbi:MAG TPA: PD-(D/E)XK nuclease family protein [Solirubrobacteraceae bacterium]|nr:PD-(D/E)XK nuclease family protein [Solirubrobacteraceae bacterium]